MVAKESVRSRMEDRDTGISYTEFSYMLLQAFDFMTLSRDYNCELQIGGSDQWGNITAGIELTRKKTGKQVYGLTLPLIMNSDGTKFGKTAAGAIWLDPKRTSIEDFYQFWIRTDDRDVIRYLQYFTFLSQKEINDLKIEHERKPEGRAAHKALAKAVTDLVHGIKLESTAANESTQGALIATEIIYNKAIESYTEIDFENLVKYGHSKTIERSAFDGSGIHLAQLLFRAGISQSVGQAKKDIMDGGIKIGSMYDRSEDQPPRLSSVKNIIFPVKIEQFIFGRYILLRKGKKNYVVVIAG